MIRERDVVEGRIHAKLKLNAYILILYAFWAKGIYKIENLTKIK